MPRRGEPHRRDSGVVRRAPNRSIEPRTPLVRPTKEILLPLLGRHGHGREVLLDLHVWKQVSESYGKMWRAVMAPDSRVFVGCWTKQAVAAAQGDGINIGDPASPLVLLSRVIARPRPGERVFTEDGNPLDMRRHRLLSASDATLASILRSTPDETRRRFIVIG